MRLAPKPVYLIARQSISTMRQAFLALFLAGAAAALTAARRPARDLVDECIERRRAAESFVWFTMTSRRGRRYVVSLVAMPWSFATPRAVLLPTAVSYGTVAGCSEQTFQILPAPFGVDAIYAWQIAGGAGDGARVGDIEQGWRLDHDELLTAKITRRSVFGSPTAKEIDHGTGVAGIVVGADNGVGTIGIVPEAELDLFSQTRANGIPNFAGAISVAAATLTAGDVLLLEEAQSFFKGGKDPRHAGRVPSAGAGPDSSCGQARYYRDRTGGNANIDLDAFPFLAHTRPESPAFSGAIVVGGATDTGPVTGMVPPRRVRQPCRCFAAFTQILSPSASARMPFNSSPAHQGHPRIIAGVAASLQAMIKAANDGRILPAC